MTRNARPGVALSMAAALMVGALPVFAAPSDVSKRLMTCTPCHDISSAGKKLVGPPLFALFEAKPTIAVPFARWDKAALDAWLTSPTKIKPDTTMVYQVGSAKQRALIIEALQALR